MKVKYDQFVFKNNNEGNTSSNKFKLKSQRIKNNLLNNFVKNEESMVGPMELGDRNHNDLCTPTKTIILDSEFSDERY